MVGLTSLLFARSFSALLTCPRDCPSGVQGRLLLHLIDLLVRSSGKTRGRIELGRRRDTSLLGNWGDLDFEIHRLDGEVLNGVVTAVVILDRHESRAAVSRLDVEAASAQRILPVDVVVSIRLLGELLVTGEVN